MLLRMKNFNNFTERSNFMWRGVAGGGGGVNKNQNIRGIPKKGGLGQFVDLRGAWQERGGGVFEGGLISQCPL